MSSWTKLADLDFECSERRAAINVDANRIVLASSYDPYLHIFDISTEKWTKHNFGDYKNLEDPLIILSLDKTQLYLYEAYDRDLYIINLQTLKLSKDLINIDKSELYIHVTTMIDATNNSLLHFIGEDAYSSDCIVHKTMDLNTKQLVKSCTIIEEPSVGSEGAAIIHLKNAQRWMYFGDKTNICIYDLNKKQWNNTGVKLPFAFRYFGHIKTRDERFIIIIGGKYWSEGGDWKRSNKIYALNVNTLKFYQFDIEAPVTSDFNAVLTSNDYIHLFVDNQHWKIDMNDLLPLPTDIIVAGFVRDFGNIPMDIMGLLVEYCGYLLNAKQI